MSIDAIPDADVAIEEIMDFLLGINNLDAIEWVEGTLDQLHAFNSHLHGVPA